MMLVARIQSGACFLERMVADLHFLIFFFAMLVDSWGILWYNNKIKL